MRAATTSLLNLIRNTPCFVVPIFQRAYAWREEQCSTLFNDIIRIGQFEDERKHFVGSVVYVAPESGLSSDLTPRILIDGQQRIATISLMLLALAKVLGSDRVISDFDSRRIYAYWLLNELESGDAKYKLQLSNPDRETLRAVITGSPLPMDCSKQVINNLRYFEDQLKSNNIDLDHVCRGIRRLVVVEISLSAADDNPQLIFESLNSKGRELSQSDLIRNYVLMRQPKITQDELYIGYWKPLEDIFRDLPDENTFDEFMRHFLTLRMKELLPRSDIYNLFRRYVESPQFFNTTSEQLLEELLKYARYYATITNLPAAGAVPDSLRNALDDYRLLQANVILPFLLEIHHDFTQNRIDVQSYINVLRLIETFLTRRFVCEVPTNQLRKVFFDALGRLDKTVIVDALTQYLMNGAGGARMPRNDEFQKAFVSREIYMVRRWASLILQRLEQHENGEPPDFKQLSIEHIMPQKLSDDWKELLGDDAQILHAEWLHTIGNLTLTGYNPEYSNRTFAEKRDLPKIGLAASGLQLNADFINLKMWNIESIRDRAERLAARAIRVWPIPITEESKIALDTHSLDRFSSLNIPIIRALFTLLDENIRSLHTEITQHTTKHTIQYKIHKSVCDLIPNKSNIKVIINLPYAGIRDPKGLARDVTHVGHWGNGNVEARVQRANDIDDVLELIRQVFQ